MVNGHSDTLVLEIYKSDNRLKMSVSQESELDRTVRHYSLCPVSFDDVYRICREITAILSRRRGNSSAAGEHIAGLKKCGKMLWEQLLTRSVKSILKSCGNKHLILSLDEELVGIPWELLYDGSDFLGLKFSSGRLIRSQHEGAKPKYRPVSPRPKMLILANPTNDLRSAYDEGINIRDQLDKSREKIGVDFKSSQIGTLYVKKSLRDYDIVHFAGHCECEKEYPQNTGWVLTDGRFTTSDILAMSEDSLLPSLIFSNACQSAQVNKDGIDEDYQEKTYSLASAFLFSGVRHYIGAIRKIEDPASFAFAREFYSRLVRHDSVGEAVRLGRLRLVGDYGLDSCLWASYILYGDPDFILLPGGIPRPGRAKINTGFLRGHKKQVIRSLLATGIVLSAFFLVFLAWNFKPGSYLQFKKARAAFKAGKNSEVTAIAASIVKLDPGFLDAYPLLAGSFSRLGKKEEAQKYYFEYILQSEKMNDHAHLCDAYILAGWFYQEEGSYPKAYEFYQKAVSLSRSSKDKLHEAQVLRKLALWNMDKGDNEEALRLLTLSSEINRERQSSPGHRYNLACDYFDLGLLFSDKEDYKSAQEFYNKSQKAFNALNLKNEISDYYFNLGEICVQEKSYQKALAYYLKGLEIDQFQDNKPSICADLVMLGELYQEMEDLSKAEDYFKKAQALAAGIGSRMELAAADYCLGSLYRKENKKNLARRYLRRAQEVYRQVDTPQYRSIQQELLSLDDTD